MADKGALFPKDEQILTGMWSGSHTVSKLSAHRTLTPFKNKAGLEESFPRDREQDPLFERKNAVAYNVLKRDTQTGFTSFIVTLMPFMSLSSGSPHASTLSEMLQALLGTKQTGYLKMQE